MSNMIVIDDLPLLKDDKVQEFKDDKEMALELMRIMVKHPGYNVSFQPFEPYVPIPNLYSKAKKK